MENSLLKLRKTLLYSILVGFDIHCMSFYLLYVIIIHVCFIYFLFMIEHLIENYPIELFLGSSSGTGDRVGSGNGVEMGVKMFPSNPCMQLHFAHCIWKNGRQEKIRNLEVFPNCRRWGQNKM